MEEASVGGTPEKPLVWLLGDCHLAQGSLSRILEDGDCCVATVSSEELPRVTSESSTARLPDLIVLPFAAAEEEVLAEVRRIRATARARSIPILGIAGLRRLDLDIPSLRAHGIVGLIDERSGSEHALERINQIVRPFRSRRACERVPCFLPLEVERDGRWCREYALNLSLTGMRMTSSVPVEPNTDVAFRTALPLVGEGPVEGRARVVYRAPKRNSAGLFEAGAFFYPMEPEARRLVESELVRLLTD